MKWSFSTHQAVRRCERSVFLTQQYASHHPSDPGRRRAWVLKQAQGERLWIGSVVHSVLAQKLVPQLRTGLVLPTAEELVAEACALGRRQLAFSEQGRFNDGDVTKSLAGPDFCVLEWHVIPDRVAPPEPLTSLAEVASICFDRLYSDELQPVLARLIAATTVMPERRLTFYVGQCSATATLDVLTTAPGRHCVVDWKVSRSPTADNTFQLDVYALAVNRAVTGAVAGAVDVIEINLLTGVVRERTPRPDDLDLTENTIRSSANAMRSLDPNGEDLVEFAAGLVVTDNPNSCAMCSMQPLCAELEGVARYHSPEPQGRLVFA